MRIKYPFTNLFLLSILLMIIGWIINALMWTGYFPHRFFNQSIFIGMLLLYLGVGLGILSLLFGFIKIIRNV